MDGDIAKGGEFVKLCMEYGAMSYIDDAHGEGVIGPDGRGMAAHFGVEGKLDESQDIMQEEIVQRKKTQKKLTENNKELTKTANQIRDIMMTVGITNDDKKMRFENPSLVSRTPATDL